MVSKDVEHLKQNLETGIETAKGVDGDFIYITVGDAKRILQMFSEREPKSVHDMRLSGHHYYGYCPNCLARLDLEEGYCRQIHMTNYCSACGQAVKWR